MNSIVRIEKISDPELQINGRKKYLLTEIGIGFTAEDNAKQIVIDCRDNKIFSILSGMLMCATLPDNEVLPAPQFTYKPVHDSKTIIITGCLADAIKVIALSKIISPSLHSAAANKLELSIFKPPIPGRSDSSTYNTYQGINNAHRSSVQITEETPLLLKV